MARKMTAEMAGEVCREIGALFALFFPLEHIVVRGERPTLGFVAIGLALSGVLISIGILIERRRRLEQ